MRKPLFTPEELWVDFKTKALDPKNLPASSVESLRLTFLGGLIAATEFFETLLSDDYLPNERRVAYKAWGDSFANEVSEIEGMLWQDILGGVGGRDN